MNAGRHADRESRRVLPPALPCTSPPAPSLAPSLALPLALLLAMLVPISGCLSPEPDLPELRAGEPDPRLWDGSSLEGLSCTVFVGIFEVPADRVQAHLPENLTTRGDTLAEVFLRVFHCDALLLDVGAPMEDAWLYLALAPLHAGAGVPVEPVFLLEAGSDRPALLADLSARGVPVLEAKFQRDATGTTLTAPDAAYRLRTAPPGPALLSGQQPSFNLLAGPDGAERLVLEMPVEPWSATPGILEADGGVLGDLLDAPRPLHGSEQENRFLLRHPHNEE